MEGLPRSSHHLLYDYKSSMHILKAIPIFHEHAPHWDEKDEEKKWTGWRA